MKDDPFSTDEDDRTVLQPGSSHKPTPDLSNKQHDNSPHENHISLSAPGSVPLYGGINKLEQAASRLLPLIVTLKNSSSHPAPEQLRNSLIRELDEFKKQARHILKDPKKATQASYVMCTVLDEAAMNTPWGHQANWSQHNLLSTFHNEVAGGQKFFALLKVLGKEPGKNIDLLELMYVCLSLGYEGSYRIANNGQETLIKVRNWVYETIRSVRDQPITTLSESWHGSDIQERKLSRLTPLWVLSAAALGLASVIYMSLRINLSSRADNTISTFWNVKAEELSIRSVVPLAKPRIKATVINQHATSLTQLLSSDIESGLLEVIETFDMGKIRLKGSSLFSSGRADIGSSYSALINNIASALNKFDGKILVIGHSDNIPVRTGRYPSNLELSRARAQSVVNLLSGLLIDKARLVAEGRGSMEPIANNETKEGRDQNRRVEINIFY
ncbi:MAG: type IVB secretion system protein IcmH/DotU [Granulosicoccus sp.]